MKHRLRESVDELVAWVADLRAARDTFRQRRRDRADRWPIPTKTEAKPE